MASSNTNGTDAHNAEKRIFLAYFPRAAHHLFMRMFSGHPELAMLESLAHMDIVADPTIQLAACPSLEDATEQCEALRSNARRGWLKWEDHITQLEGEGKRVLNSLTFAFVPSPPVHNQWLNEKLDRISKTINSITAPKTSPESYAYWHLDPAHSSPDNPFIFSDVFLQSHTPILLIRHPALAFPSTIRVADQYFTEIGGAGDAFMNLIFRYQWMVVIYEWYTEKHLQRPDLYSEPLILDADDMMYNREAVAELCRQLGLNPQNTKYEWPKTTAEVVYDKEEIFQDTLSASTSIVGGKSSANVNVKAEHEKWKAEFGEERARKLLDKVEGAMSDYDFLRERGIGFQIAKNGGQK